MAGRQGFGIGVHGHLALVQLAGEHRGGNGLGKGTPAGGHGKRDDVGVGSQSVGRNGDLDEDRGGHVGRNGCRAGSGRHAGHPSVDVGLGDGIIVGGNADVLDDVRKGGALAGLNAPVMGRRQGEVVVRKHHALAQETHFNWAVHATGQHRPNHVPLAGSCRRIKRHGDRLRRRSTVVD